MLTRRLWLCIGIHVAWNATLGSIFQQARFHPADEIGLLECTVDRLADHLDDLVRNPGLV